MSNELRNEKVEAAHEAIKCMKKLSSELRKISQFLNKQGIPYDFQKADTARLKSVKARSRLEWANLGYASKDAQISIEAEIEALRKAKIAINYLEHPVTSEYENTVKACLDLYQDRLDKLNQNEVKHENTN